MLTGNRQEDAPCKDGGLQRRNNRCTANLLLRLPQVLPLYLQLAQFSQTVPAASTTVRYAVAATHIATFMHTALPTTLSSLVTATCITATSPLLLLALLLVLLLHPPWRVSR